MSEKHLTASQQNEIEKLKRQWMEESKPYLNNLPLKRQTLDGENSAMLARIQDKYKKRIQEVIEASE